MLYQVHMIMKSTFLAGIFSHIGTAIAWLLAFLLLVGRDLFETALEVLFSFLTTTLSCPVAQIISDGRVHFLF